jgi:prepilin-type processing-associated H-X9-DG protein
VGPFLGYVKHRIDRGPFCGANLSDLGKAMLNYASDNDDQYPTAEKWCDLLIAHCEVSPKQFVCPLSDAKEGESSYTFNENLIGKKFTEVPPDVVILFETKEGWNQFGGPEILTTGNHKYQGEGGCNILFGDSHVSFVRTEQLGELKWEVE